MANVLPVFVDTNVVISSLLSPHGAARMLIQHNSIRNFVSNISLDEAKRVATQLHLSINVLEETARKYFHVLQLKKGTIQKYTEYVTDIYDTHIVAGAHKGKVRFLASYNMRHFKMDAMKSDLSILVYTPATILQYLRCI